MQYIENDSSSKLNIYIVYFISKAKKNSFEVLPFHLIHLANKFDVHMFRIY